MNLTKKHMALICENDYFDSTLADLIHSLFIVRLSLSEAISSSLFLTSIYVYIGVMSTRF